MILTYDNKSTLICSKFFSFYKSLGVNLQILRLRETVRVEVSS